MKSYHLKLHYFLLILFLICIVGLLSCKIGQNSIANHHLLPAETIPETTLSSENPPFLKIRAENSDKITVYKPETLDGGFDRDLVYFNVADVTIEINGKIMQLHNAICDGYITAAELFAYARLDAANGFCTENYQSTRTGLTAFVYTYEDVDLWMLYDVLYAPDGQKHKITKITVYPPGEGMNTIPGHYRDLETGEWLDREDWGLEFTVTEASPTQLSLQCTQAEGQHLGQLHATIFTITKTAGQQSTWARPIEIKQEYAITNNGTTELTLEWINPLPSGNYNLNVHIEDHFQGTDIHPLMVDFNRVQDYEIPFSIS